MEKFQFLRSKYQKEWVNNTLHEYYFYNISFFCSVSTAIYLCCIHRQPHLGSLRKFGISTVVTANSLKSCLSSHFVMEAQAIYKSRSSLIHAQMKEAAFFLIWGEDCKPDSRRAGIHQSSRQNRSLAINPLPFLLLFFCRLGLGGFPNLMVEVFLVFGHGLQQWLSNSLLIQWNP